MKDEAAGDGCKHFPDKINENQENLTELKWIAARIRAGTSKC
jgi:hypothetical protein